MLPQGGQHLYKPQLGGKSYERTSQSTLMKQAYRQLNIVSLARVVPKLGIVSHTYLPNIKVSEARRMKSAPRQWQLILQQKYHVQPAIKNEKYSLNRRQVYETLVVSFRFLKGVELKQGQYPSGLKKKVGEGQASEKFLFMKILSKIKLIMLQIRDSA